MRDFFAHITQNRDQHFANEAFAYFNDLFPEADNTIKFYDDIIFVFSTDCAVDKITSPLWSESKKAYLFFSGDFYLPPHLTLSSGQLSDGYNDILHLFELYGETFFENISGNFNVLIYYLEDRRFVLVNSKLGLNPLYYYQSGYDFFVFVTAGGF